MDLRFQLGGWPLIKQPLKERLIADGDKGYAEKKAGPKSAYDLIKAGILGKFPEEVITGLTAEGRTGDNPGEKKSGKSFWAK